MNWLKSMFGHPRPPGPSELIRSFRTTDPTLSRDCITVDQDGWVVVSEKDQTVRLFEVQEPHAESCLLSYRAKIRTEDPSGGAFLEMWCRLPGRGEFFSKGLDQAVKGTTDWASSEIPFYLKEGESPDLVKLNLVVGGAGRVWIRDVELLKTPLR